MAVMAEVRDQLLGLLERLSQGLKQAAGKEEVQDELLVLVEDMKKATDLLRRTSQTLHAKAHQPDSGHPEEKSGLTDREAFLRMKESLLAEHRGKFVAFANGRLIAASHSVEELSNRTRAVDHSVDVYIERVDDEAFLEPPEFQSSGVHEISSTSERDESAALGQAQGDEPEPVTDRDSFLRAKDFLLRHYRDMFVAFAGGRVVAAGRSIDELRDELDSMQPRPDVFVEPVNEEAFQGSGAHVMTGIYGMHEVT